MAPAKAGTALPNTYSPWENLISHRPYRNIDHKLHHEILAFDAYARPTPKESEMLQTVLQIITDVVQLRLRDAQVMAFGSTVTGLTLPVPDLDLVIMSGALRTPRDIKNQLFSLKSAFYRAGLIDTAEVRSHAKVPIIRFTTRPLYGSIDIDISINHTDGVDVANIINLYNTRMPALRPLALILKSMISAGGLSDPARSGIGSYAVVCMCISFLQVNRSQLDTKFIEEPVKSESLGILLIDLLHYYAMGFDYDNQYISVKEGKVLPKEGVDWIRESSAPFLVVQCLKNEDKNIAASIGGSLPKLKNLFKTAYLALLQKTDPSRSGILSGITGFRKEALDHRRAIDSLSSSSASASSSKPQSSSHPPRARPPPPSQPRPRKDTRDGPTYGYERLNPQARYLDRDAPYSRSSAPRYQAGYRPHNTRENDQRGSVISIRGASARRQRPGSTERGGHTGSTATTSGSMYSVTRK